MKYAINLFSITILCLILIFSINCFYNYFYPMKYKEEIVSVSNRSGVDAAMIAAVSNVESGYKKDAVSNKGAVGIMQLMPKTAKWIASKNNIEYNEEKLKEPFYNLQLGSLYLSYLMQEYQDLQVSICAYNAGQGNVSSWLQNSEYSKDGKTLSKIPFKETRNYLKRVNKNYNYYKNKYK